jgi:hypothetical protein
MSRRPPTGPLANVDRARGRMAPGGRMWSESPVVPVRRRVGAAGIPQILVPDYVAPAGYLSNANPKRITTEAGDNVCLIIGSTDQPYPSVPSGWTVLGQWDSTVAPSQYQHRFQAVCITDAPAGNHDFGGGGAAGVLVRGAPGGVFTVAAGPQVSGDPNSIGRFRFAPPAAGTAVRAQVTILHGCYTGLVGPFPPGYVGTEGQGTPGSVVWPREQIADTPELIAAHYGPDSPTQDPDPTWTYSTIGAYGWPSSAAFTITWN